MRTRTRTSENRTRIKQLFAAAFGVVLVAGMVAPVAVLAGDATAQSGPPDHALERVPSENVGPPDHAQGGPGNGNSGGNGNIGPPQHALENIPSDAGFWDVRTSRHSEDLEAVIGADAEGKLEMLLRDDRNHEGRTVAVSQAALEEAHGGDLPESVFGLHESGDEWASEVEYEDGMAHFDVPKFSENTVTFEGTVTLSGNPATDGTQFSYDVADPSSVDNFSVDVTGSTAREWGNQSAGLGSGETLSVSTAGTSPPTGPASGEPRVSVTPTAISASTGYNGGGTGYLYTGDSPTTDVFPAAVPSGKVNRMAIRMGQSSGRTTTLDVTLNGTQVASGVEVTEGTGWNYFSIDPIELSGQSGVTVGITNTGSNNVNTRPAGENGSGDHGVILEGTPTSATVDADDGSSASFGMLSDGNTETAPLDLSTSASSLTFSPAGGGRYEVGVELQQVVETGETTVEVNGETASTSGPLADGETTSLSADSSWIRAGTNRINVSVAGPSDAPTPQVGLDYSHQAVADVSADVSGETWNERYNVSRTFGADQADATLTIPFSSSRVISVEDVEMRTNGGTWTSVDTANRSFDGSEISLHLGSVTVGETVAVRATGKKVQVQNGGITVLEPTVAGDRLSTRFEVSSVSESGKFGIDVSGTSVGDRLHYLPETSFSGGTFAEVTASGGQILRAPNANDGSTATVETVPVTVAPESGAMEALVVEEDSDHVTFQVREGNTTGASTVEVGYHDTISGERYVLWDEQADAEVDAATAQSPVWFLTDGSNALYSVLQADGSYGITEPSGSTGGPTGQQTGFTDLLFIPALGLTLVGLFYVNRRWNDSSKLGNYLLAGGAVAVALVSAELVTPRSLVSDFLFSTSGAIDAGAGAALVSVGLLLALWQINQRTSADVPVLVRGGVALLAILLTAEQMRPGSILGPVQGIVSEYGGPMLLLGILIAGGILWRRASTPDTVLELGRGKE